MSKSLRRVLSYNENKVSEGTARCIGGEGFGIDVGELNFNQKVARFRELTIRNRRSKTNIAHAVLSFAPGEKPSKRKLLAIADAYMTKVGFGDQPYLVYQHHDTANTHIHIVSTNIRMDGSRIHTHLIGATLGAKARVEIEQEYGLVRTGERREVYYQGIPPLDLRAYLAAGKKGKATISAIVRSVIAKYQFTSLTELNAILKQFNITADPGQEGSILREKKGLLYSAIDSTGEKVGSQIRSSTIYVPGWSGLPDNAGLTLLNAKFRRDRYRRREYKEGLLSKVERALQGGVTFGQLQANLRQDCIEMAVQYNINGYLSGVMFIDNQQGVVYKGSDLKKGLGAAGLAARLVNATGIQRRIALRYFNGIIRKTDFAAGFPSVLQQWRTLGLTIDARVVAADEVYFFMQTSMLAPAVALPVSAKIDRYLRANLSSIDRRERRMIDDIELYRYAALYAGLHQYTGSGHLKMSPLEELLHAEDPYNYLATDLIREAKKKKKRRNRSP